MSHVCSWWSAFQCFFGGAGCSEAPGIRGTLYIAMHVISHLAGANLLRHAEGATLLAIVTVRDLGKNKTTSFASVRSWLHWYPRTSG